MMTQRVKQILLVGLCALAVVVGVMNVLWVRTLPIDIAERDKKIIVERVHKSTTWNEFDIRKNDVIIKINDRELPTIAEALWEIERATQYETVTFTLQRGDSIFTAGLVKNRPMPIGHGFLVIFIGVVFLALGLFVWWPVIGDSLVAAFLRLNIITGIAVLLESLTNAFQPVFFHYAYSLAWMTCYCLIPGALLDFILRFSRKQYPRFKWHTFVLYFPPLLLAITLSILFLSASATQNPILISLFYVGRSTILGLLMLAYFVITFLLLVHAWRRSARPEERNCNRWLLLCTFVGVAPFILLHKLPTLWGGLPLVTLDQALIFLPVAPIGWGMAVASFRLLRIEWTLSRTIVYVVSAGIVLYAMIILLSFGAGKYKAYNAGAIAALIVVAAFIAYLAGLSLAKGIRSAVDRVYYGDWYNFRDAVQNLSHKLSGSILEQDIVSILTEQFPDLLRIEKAILLIRGDDGTWIPPPQRNAPMVAEFTNTLTRLEELIVKSGKGMRAVSVPRHHPFAVWGVTAVLPLVHAGRVMGCLLLGRKDPQSPYSVRDFQLLDAVSSFSGM
ncbi:PDZ domain-containing protein, partial [bacterium]|nr:PDZ domain-containing protein [bacterium]